VVTESVFNPRYRAADASDAISGRRLSVIQAMILLTAGHLCDGQSVDRHFLFIFDQGSVLDMTQIPTRGTAPFQVVTGFFFLSQTDADRR